MVMGAVQEHIIWNRVFAISINKDITVISYCGPPNVNPEDAQKEQCLQSGSYQAAITPYGEQETKDVKNQCRILAPDSWCIWKEWFQWAQTLESSHTQKSTQYSSVTQSWPTHWDPINRKMPGLPVHHQLPEFTQTYVHRVSDAIQPSHPLSSPSPPAPNPSQHQSLFQWVNSSHEVAKVLEFQLQHHSLQRTSRTDLL